MDRRESTKYKNKSPTNIFRARERGLGFGKLTTAVDAGFVGVRRPVDYLAHLARFPRVPGSGRRPASRSARRSRNSIWPFRLRSSSRAQRSSASSTRGSTRKRKDFLSATRLLVESPGIEYRLGRALAAEYN